MSSTYIVQSSADGVNWRDAAILTTSYLASDRLLIDALSPVDIGNSDKLDIYVAHDNGTFVCFHRVVAVDTPVVDCDKCDGNGQYECADCNGQGCEFCEERGWHLCEKCLGDGMVKGEIK